VKAKMPGEHFIFSFAKQALRVDQY